MSVTTISYKEDGSVTRETTYLNEIVLKKVNDAWQSIKNMFFTMISHIYSLAGRANRMIESNRPNEKEPEAPQDEEKKSDSSSECHIHTFYGRETPVIHSKILGAKFRFIGLEN